MFVDGSTRRPCEVLLVVIHDLVNKYLLVFFLILLL